MCKWYIVLFSAYEQISLMNGSNISGWLLIKQMINELDNQIINSILVSLMDAFGKPFMCLSVTLF
jgi:hypothetical protein